MSILNIASSQFASRGYDYYIEEKIISSQQKQNIMI